MKGKLQFEAGRIWWKQIRFTLDKCKIEYPDFTYIEGPGIITKMFVMYGSKELLEAIKDLLPHTEE
jgi:hypothetical protein